MSLSSQIVWLFLLAIPIACASWTVTHEEVFREPREYCARISRESSSLWIRKFFYLFTCEYCFSHYVTAFFLLLTGYKLLAMDWRGFLIAWLALVWVANQYMTLYANIRVDLKVERYNAQKVEGEARKVEKEAQKIEKEIEQKEQGGKKFQRPAA